MKPLLDLAINECRWPVTDDKPFLFCGERKPHGASYCACHKRMSVSAEQPVPFSGRAADFFAGGRVRAGLRSGQAGSTPMGSGERMSVDARIRQSLAGRQHSAIFKEAAE